MSEHPVWMTLSLDAAMSRLKFWQDALIDAERAKDPDRIREATRFVEEYGQLIADAPPCSSQLGPRP